MLKNLGKAGWNVIYTLVIALAFVCAGLAAISWYKHWGWKKAFSGLDGLAYTVLAQSVPTATTTPTTGVLAETLIVASENIVVITVEPTLSVATHVLLNPDFAKVHLPAEQMRGVSFTEQTRVIVLEGRETTVAATIPQLTGANCNDFTKRDAVALVYLMGKRFGQSFSFTGPLIGSESAFVFYEYDGPNGTCSANQNNAGAPAYCAGQIYQPNGAGGQTHPEFDLFPTGNEPRASLQDPVYCMAASMKVYRDDFGGNSMLAAANYKGFWSSNDPSFVSNYMPWYDAGGVTVDGITVPFVDDDALIRSLLGPEIEKWEASIQDFYQRLPDFYGH